MSLPTRVFDGVALVTRTKAVCQAVWPAWKYCLQPGSRGGFGIPKNRKCVAWATRIDKQPWFVWHWPHGFSAVWPVPHEPRLFVNPCGWRSTSSKFGGSPRRKVSILYPCSLETILDDFTLQKTVNVLPGPHGLTNSLKICEPGNTVVRRCCQVHIF